MELVVSRDNMMTAYRRVMANKGSAGVDDMSVDALMPYLKEHWAAINLKQTGPWLFVTECLLCCDVQRDRQLHTHELATEALSDYILSQKTARDLPDTTTIGHILLDFPPR